MILKFLRFFFFTALGLIFGLLGLIAFVLVAIMITGAIDSVHANCNIDQSQNITHVEFVGRNLNLPTKQIKECSRNPPMDFFGDETFAYISLAGSFHDFSPLQNEEKLNYYDNENALVIDIKGAIQTSDYPLINSSDLEKEFESLMIATDMVEGKNVPRYQAGEKLQNNMTVYKGNALFGDVYVHRTGGGNIDLIFNCEKENVRFYPRCKSRGVNIYDNVNYNYDFALIHVHDALNIDKLVRSVVNQIISEQENIN